MTVKWDEIKEKMDVILVDMSDIGFAIEFCKVWNQIEEEGGKLRDKIEAIKRVMETMCYDVDCDLFNEDKAEWCDKCPIFKLEKILEGSDT